MGSNCLLKRGGVLLLLLLAIACVSGCRLEVGRQDDATPTPTATPSPTATPDTGTDTDTDTDTSTASSDSSTAEAAAADTDATSESASKSSTGATDNVSFASVALAEAEYLEDATALAAEEAASSRLAVEQATGNEAEARSLLLQAAESLSLASSAYLKAESAVFFVDPGSKEELIAQPDPLGSGALGGSVDELDDLTKALEEIDQLLTQPLNREAVERAMREVESISPKISDLETSLRGFANAWTASDQDNFRNAFFLYPPEEAVARIFQGLLALSGDILPARLSATKESTSGMYESLGGVREMYIGPVAELDNSSSLYALVDQKSPIQAALTRASLARAVALAGVLDVVPESDSTREQLQAALSDLTKQLTLSAESIGIVIVEDQ